MEPYEEEFKVLRDQVDDETFEFIHAADGFNTTFEWTATEAFQACVEDFTTTTRYRTVKGGLDTVLRCLAQEIEAAGGKIFTHNSLRSFCKAASGQFCYKLAIHDSKENRLWTVFANDIILCVPKRGLALLDPRSLLFTEDAKRGSVVTTHLHSVKAEPATKVLMGFTQPWWNETLGLRGRTVTDLPIRQSYYFGVKGDVPATSVVLASYADMDASRFWRRLQDSGRQPPIFEKDRESLYGRNWIGRSRGYEEANSSVVKEVMRQLQEVHGENVVIPQPCSTAYKDWSVDPHGGAFHCWKPGARMWEIAPIMRRPLDKERIFIAGEAYSDLQGWVEGAFCTAEHIMRQCYSLAAPEWLDDVDRDEPYYLGW